MHTVVVRMSVDPTRVDEVDRHLRQDVVPWARRQRGFVSGQWLRGTDNRGGLGVIVFDSEAAAVDAAEGPRSVVYPAGTAWSIASVDVFEQVVVAT